MEDNRQEITDKDSGRLTTTGDIEVSTYLEIAKEKGGAQPAATETPSVTATPTEFSPLHRTKVALLDQHLNDAVHLFNILDRPLQPVVNISLAYFLSTLLS